MNVSAYVYGYKLKSSFIASVWLLPQCVWKKNSCHTLLLCASLAFQQEVIGQLGHLCLMLVQGHAGPVWACADGAPEGEVTVTDVTCRMISISSHFRLIRPTALLRMALVIN